MFDKQMIERRLKSFFYEAGSILLLALVTAVTSPEFASVVQEHAGSSIFGTVIVLLFTASVKELRNAKVQEKLGGDGNPTLL